MNPFNVRIAKVSTAKNVLIGGEAASKGVALNAKENQISKLLVDL